MSEHEVTISTGRRAQDGRLRLSVFADGLLSLGIEGQGERVPTLLLTLEQARQLQDALAQLIPLAVDDEERAARRGPQVEAWQGVDRRMSGDRERRERC
ncbi:MAG TPA: hypothetical protein VF544_23550 [Pyrinomonadaceae bacterium]